MASKTILRSALTLLIFMGMAGVSNLWAQKTASGRFRCNGKTIRVHGAAASLHRNNRQIKIELFSDRLGGGDKRTFGTGTVVGTLTLNLSVSKGQDDAELEDLYGYRLSVKCPEEHLSFYRSVSSKTPSDESGIEDFDARLKDGGSLDIELKGTEHFSKTDTEVKWSIEINTKLIQRS